MKTRFKTLYHVKNASEKLIVALDVPEIADAVKLVDQLSDEVMYYKIGLELMMSGSYFELIKWLKNKNIYFKKWKII